MTDKNGGVLKESNLQKVTSVEKFEDRDWDRDSIEQRVAEVRSNRDTIETILQNIEQKLANVPSKDELEEQWSKYLEKVAKDENDEPKRYPPAFVEAAEDRAELLQRRAEWEARLRELEDFALGKMEEKFNGLLVEHRSLKADSTFQDILNVQEELAEIRQMKSDFEKFGQALREENRSLWNMVERLAEEDGNSLSDDELEEIGVRSLEKFVDQNGVFTLDTESLEKQKEESEREGAAESAADEVLESDDEDEITAREDLVENWDDYYSMMTQEDIAKELDKSQSWVSTVKNEEGLEN